MPKSIAHFQPGNGKGRTGQTSGDNIHTLKDSGISKLVQVLLNDVPGRAIMPERCTGMRADINQPCMIDAGLLQANGLAATACSSRVVSVAGLR
jgi:hypothetical protein